MRVELKYVLNVSANFAWARIRRGTVQPEGNFPFPFLEVMNSERKKGALIRNLEKLFIPVQDHEHSDFPLTELVEENMRN